MENNQPNEWLKDLPVQTENVAFKPEEMIACAKCRRMNPPNRPNCVYCGGELDAADARSQFLKLNLRKLESWEKGFNIILLPNLQIFDEAKTAEIAGFLKMEKETLQKMNRANKPLPVVRIESPKEAEIIKTRLREFNIESLILSDEALAFDRPTRRLRGIEFFDDKLILILFNQDEVTEITTADLALIVVGAMFERRIEATEKHNKKGDNVILNQTETASDEVLFDIYNRRDSLGFRIYAKGFDFSCLEADKKLLAKDNIKKLTETLRRFAPDAKFVDDYVQNRSLLADVWNVEQKTDSRGLKREGFGKFNLGNITTVNNLSQFTKYSRLQWHLL